jgi:hypothetical protein
VTVFDRLQMLSLGGPGGFNTEPLGPDGLPAHAVLALVPPSRRLARAWDQGLPLARAFGADAMLIVPARPARRVETEEQ